MPRLRGDAATSVRAAERTTIVLETVVQGSPPIFYQWFHNKRKIPGATNATLTVTNATVRKAGGTYFALVTNTVGAALSSTGALQVITPVSLVRAPRSRTVLEGRKAIFTVSARGTAPLRYQWWMNSNPILNATNRSLVIPAAHAGDAGNYTATVSNVLSGAVSLPGVLTVKPRGL